MILSGRWNMFIEIIAARPVVYPMLYDESNMTLILLTLTVIHSSSYNNGGINAVHIRATGVFSVSVGD